MISSRKAHDEVRRSSWLPEIAGELRWLGFIFLLIVELHGFLVGLFGKFEGFGGVFHCLAGMFVAGEVVFFAVVGGGGLVSVGGLHVKFSGTLMRIVGHGGSVGISVN